MSGLATAQPAAAVCGGAHAPAPTSEAAAFSASASIEWAAASVSRLGAAHEASLKTLASKGQTELGFLLDTTSAAYQAFEQRVAALSKPPVLLALTEPAPAPP